MIQHSILGEIDDDNGKYKLFIENPLTPQDEFMNDIFISLQQMKAGDVGDLAKCLQQLREELGLNEDDCHTDKSILVAFEETFS
ncbi:MAG: hypothetical protein OXE46_02755 [Chloroflexi bacterium]|nr:hypothetical protein [Chloroflexota bacterium]